MPDSILVLRCASLADGELLYEWRMNPLTRVASHQTGPIDFSTHMTWLASVLANPGRDIYIAEADGVPVGTIRVDRYDDASELSWTVAPAARGRGIGTRMVVLAAGSIPGAISAQIKDDNFPSIRIAEAAGMRLDRKMNGTLHFRRCEIERPR